MLVEKGAVQWLHFISRRLANSTSLYTLAFLRSLVSSVVPSLYRNFGFRHRKELPTDVDKKGATACLG